MTYIIKNNMVYFSAKEFNYLYELSGADCSSFSILGESHAKDKNNVYYQNRVIVSASKEDFISIDTEFGKDSRSVFWQTIVLKNAGPISFKSLGNRYAQDCRHFYECASIIEHLPSRFELEKVVNPQKDRMTSIKEKLKNGDFKIIDELINEEGYRRNHLEVFVWMTIAMELNYKRSEFIEVIEIIKNEGLSEKQIRKGYKKVSEIFKPGEWVQMNNYLAEKYLNLSQ